jgi:cell wall-associated NlpC family hydrolase
MGNLAKTPYLFPGDIVCTRGTSWISRAIRWASRSFGERKTVVNHVGLIVSAGDFVDATIAEARWRYLVHNFFRAYSGTGQQVAIFRPKHIAYTRRADIADRARSFKHQKYGWLKIALHAADKLLNGAYFFRRLSFVPNRPICSYAVARAYADYGYSFGVTPYQAQPDDIWDYCANSDNYELIFDLQEI